MRGDSGRPDRGLSEDRLRATPPPAYTDTDGRLTEAARKGILTK